MDSFHWKVPKPMASTASSTMNVSERTTHMKIFQSSSWSQNTVVDTFQCVSGENFVIKPNLTQGFAESYVSNGFSQTLPSVGFANSRGTGAPSASEADSRSVCSAIWTTCSLFSPSSSERVLSPVRRKRTILERSKTKSSLKGGSSIFAMRKMHFRQLVPQHKQVTSLARGLAFSG